MHTLHIYDDDLDIDTPVFTTKLRNLEGVDPNDIAVAVLIALTALKPLVPKPVRKPRADKGVPRVAKTT